MATHPITLDLWPKGAPHSNGLSGPEVFQEGKVGHISEARLLVYLPENENNLEGACLIFPGGGFRMLNIESMGIAFAQWLAERGIAGIVVKYRIPNGKPDIITEDALQAMKLVRQFAAEWNIKSDKVGVCGYSIGGNTASWLCNQESAEVRPDFQILFYPVISMLDDQTHVPTRENFLGMNPDSETKALYSSQLHVTKKVPPTFIALSDNDPVAPVISTVKYYESLRKHDISSCMYIFPSGGHGWTLDSDFTYIEICKELLYKWLKGQNPI